MELRCSYKAVGIFPGYIYRCKVFSLTVIGEDVYIVSSPINILSVYRETKKPNFDPFIKDVVKDLSYKKDTIFKLFDIGGKLKYWIDTYYNNFKL